MTRTSYTPWRATDLPSRTREIVAVHWNGELRIEIAEAPNAPPTLAVTFRLPRAFQGIDEGYRLRDMPVGDALIYVAATSPYLAAFRENAATTMDNFPLRHWVVVSCNECIDVLSEEEPQVLSHDA